MQEEPDRTRSILEVSAQWGRNILVNVTIVIGRVVQLFLELLWSSGAESDSKTVFVQYLSFLAIFCEGGKTKQKVKNKQTNKNPRTVISDVQDVSSAILVAGDCISEIRLKASFPFL